MSHPVRMTPQEAVSRLWSIAHTLDELSVQQSMVYEGDDGGLASILRLLYQHTEDCAMALHPAIHLPASDRSAH